MKVCAVISEYNPLHNGHSYHLKTSREQTGCDFIVCIMSGQFVQRGEVAVADKYVRAKAALLSGADMVIELPLLSSIQNAEQFALGSIRLANALQFVDFLSFGSENGNIDDLISLSNKIIDETTEIRTEIKNLQHKGLSYPKALSQSFGNLQHHFTSNNILGIEYIKALKHTNSLIKPVTIKRIGQSHHSEDLTYLSSSTAIRKAMTLQQDFKYAIPESTKDFYGNIDFSLRENNLYMLIRNILQNIDARTLAEYYDFSEGLHNKMQKSALICTNLKEFYNSVKSKRYTMARIKRLSLYTLFGITPQIISASSVTNFFNVLGIAERAKDLLRVMPKNTIIKAKDLDLLDNNAKKIIQFDILADKYFKMILNLPNYGFLSHGLVKV